MITKLTKLHPCLTDPLEIRNMRGEGPPQDHFAWDELEGDICVGIAWGLLGYKGSLCGDCVLRTGLHGKVSVRASLRGADMFKFCVRTKHTIFSPLKPIKTLTLACVRCIVQNM